MMKHAPSFTRGMRLLVVVLLIALNYNLASAAVKRVVVLKVDGLSSDAVERFVGERNSRTGKSQLPWIEHVFYENGARVRNFYVRGISLSAPSWSLLDTGQHQQVKGNVEFDRLTLHPYDYLNFIPFYLNHAAGRRVDMPGAEVLDELGVPLLVDAYPYTERHTSFQLFQRGTRWTTLQRGLQNSFARHPRELLDEFTVGFEQRNIIAEQLERELIEKLQNPRLRYLDHYVADFDHATHHNRDRATHLDALLTIDRLIGRIWIAIENSPLAGETALILVSDHGSNTSERVYSQGYNLVKLLGRRAGGGHHVVTKRRLLASYALKGLYPLVPLVHTTTDDSYYLKNQSNKYPTALLDFDGNERAAVHLRDSDLNRLHILLAELQRGTLASELRKIAIDDFFRTIERRREQWQTTLDELNEELAALRRSIAVGRRALEAQPKKWTKADADAGIDQASRRLFARLDADTNNEQDYTAYIRTLGNLLRLEPDNFDPARLKIDNLIAPGAMGESNTIHNLQNYIVGLAPGGLTSKPDGTIDDERSFQRVNYFKLLHDAGVRNNVQPGISSHPVDFVAVRLEGNLKGRLHGEVADAASGNPIDVDEIIWLYGGEPKQALILASRSPRDGVLWLRYVPIANLRAAADGRLTFTAATWQNGLPLKLWEDQQFTVEPERRAAWLAEWHTDAEWLQVAHRTEYSNAVVSLHENLAQHPVPALDVDAPGLTADERLLRRFRRRQRRLVESDLYVFANRHWNFDVRGFNPGGNHGSFFRVSTHATLMFAGGATTGIPRRLAIETPYDSLSFVPTVFALTNQATTTTTTGGGPSVPVVWQASSRGFPGAIIKELLPSARTEKRLSH